MFDLRPKYEPKHVASWHGWDLWEIAPGHYDATGNHRVYRLNGDRDHVLTLFCIRAREEERHVR